MRIKWNTTMELEIDNDIYVYYMTTKNYCYQALRDPNTLTLTKIKRISVDDYIDAYMNWVGSWT